MSRTIPTAGRRLAAAACAAAAAAGLAVIPATTASAATMRCSADQHKFIGAVHGDLDLFVQTCVMRNDNGTRAAAIKISGHTAAGVSQKAFYTFKVVTRLERYDGAVKTVTCDLTTKSNTSSWWTAKCATPAVASSATGGWTADGYFTWDEVGDGLGARRWELTGSPSIS